MWDRLNAIDNERGSAIVVALMILSLLTIVAIAATRTSDSEISIAANEVAHNMVLYGSEGAAVEGALNLEAATASVLISRSPVWLEDEKAGPEYWKPGFWDFDDSDADDNSEQSSINEEIAFAAVDTGIAPGASLDMTQASQVRAYRVFGLEDTKIGMSLVEVGYKRRF